MGEPQMTGNQNEEPHNWVWIFELGNRCVAEIRRMRALVDLCRTGIGAIPKLSPDTEDQTVTLAMTSKAKSEIDSGFCLLHAWAVVALWTHLEVFFNDLVYHSLKFSIDSCDPKRLRTIKLEMSLDKFVSMSYGQKVRLAYDEITNKASDETPMGADRFEFLLQYLGLALGHHDVLTKAVNELAQVRNTIVHNASVVDAQLIGRCEWIKKRGLRVYDKLRVTEAMYSMYLRAAAVYLQYASNCVAMRGGLERGLVFGDEFRRDMEELVTQWNQLNQPPPPKGN